MRSKIFGLCLIALILAFSPVTSQGETYLISGWVDANKTWDGDSNMCWAAGASNILAWGRWSVAPYFTASEIFTQIKASWPNIGGQSLWGYSWWLNGVLPPSAHLMVPGGNYWPAYNYGTKFEIAASASPSYIDTFLHAGYGVTLGTENSAGTSHALTCWGYNYNPASSQYYTHLYITDSDDGVEALQTYSIGQDSSGNWIFTDGSLNGWRLTGVEGFEKRWVGEFYVPQHFDLIDPNNSEIKEVFKLLPYLSFDYKWDVPHPGDPQEDRFLIQIETSNGNWETLFELFYRPEDQQTGWHSINLAIPKEFQGRHRLLFGVEGGGSVTLYRLDPAAPLPGTVWFVATGLGGLLALRRKNRPKVKAGNSARDPVSSS